MQVSRFGDTDLMVSEYGLGCARIGGIFQGDQRAFLRLLSSARDAGINFFDTADMYSQGESETLVGRAFHRARTRVVIASKAGYCLPGRRRVAARLKPLLRPLIRLLRLRRDRLPSGARGALTQDFSPAYLKNAVEATLRRLRTDYVDLLQLHSPPAAVVERGEWEPALEALKREGKIRYYGISCDTAEAALAALRFEGVSALQVLLNLVDRRMQESVLGAARARRVGVIAREALANGLLVKNPDEVDLAKYCAPEEIALRAGQLAALRQEAQARGVTLTRMALEFVTRAAGVSVTLLGARTEPQLHGLLRQTSNPSLHSD